MKTPRYTPILLAAIVAVWYLLTTLPRQLLGTCVDGKCGFSAGEIVLSIALPLLALACTVGAEMWLAGSTPRQALADLGVTRLHWPAVGLAALTLLPLLAFYPLYSLITSTQLALSPGWPWLLLGAFLYNGVNEEAMFRGLVFRRLRQDRTFWRAATLSVVFFAAAHVPSIFTFNPAVGIVSIILAIPTGYLLAYLYERGRGTIWGCVIFHAVNNGIPFIIVLAPDAQLVAASLYMLVGMLVSGGLMLWVFRAPRGAAAHPARAGSHAVG